MLVKAHTSVQLCGFSESPSLNDTIVFDIELLELAIGEAPLLPSFFSSFICSSTSRWSVSTIVLGVTSWPRVMRCQYEFYQGTW